MSQKIPFKIIHQSKKSNARVCEIETPHGIIRTPNFVPVATNASLKAVDSITANSLDIDLVFSNTYHLMIQPGLEVLDAMGGIHNFSKRSGPIITDSGGFQVFSLAYGSIADEIKGRGQKKTQGQIVKINDEGVTFRSYRDGSKILLSPETSINAQKTIGADLIVVFDELPPYHIDPDYLHKSLDRTHEWEKRSLDVHLKNRNQQGLYSVIHGGVNKELRKHSVETLAALDFDGHAIGGSLGKNKEEMISIVRYTRSVMPNDRPIHLLGIGDLANIEQLIDTGIDTFDSAYPTKIARHGMLLSSEGPVKITRSCFKHETNPLPGCESSPIFKDYTPAYLHHLFKAHELTAYTLASIHNLYYMNKLFADYRQAILEDRL